MSQVGGASGSDGRPLSADMRSVLVYLLHISHDFYKAGPLQNYKSQQTHWALCGGHNVLKGTCHYRNKEAAIDDLHVLSAASKLNNPHRLGTH